MNLSPWKRIRQSFEVALCRLGFWILPRLPYSILLLLARVAGSLAFLAARSERKIALANLELVLGHETSEYERRAIARDCFKSFARTALESLASSRLERDGLSSHFEFSPGSLDLLKQLTSRGKGLIALTFHFGNWEWLSLAWGMAGYPVTAVAQPIKNPGIEELFRKTREQAGHRLLHRKNAARQLYKTLKRREIIGLLVDLNSSVEEGGAFYPFFGVPALTTRSVGLLALRTGAPIVCSVAYPKPDGRYCIEIGPEIPFDPNADSDSEMDSITRKWLAHCEATIRKQPHFWMWMYKRWKARPTPEQGSYPFYSFFDPKLQAATRS